MGIHSPAAVFVAWPLPPHAHFVCGTNQRTPISLVRMHLVIPLCASFAITTAAFAKA
jgi:hypothetical protein